MCARKHLALKEEEGREKRVEEKRRKRLFKPKKYNFFPLFRPELKVVVGRGEGRKAKGGEVRHHQNSTGAEKNFKAFPNKRRRRRRRRGRGKMNHQVHRVEGGGLKCTALLT